MRIIVHGQQAFGKSVLEALLARGENVVAVYCAPEKEGQKTDPLKAFALEKGLPVEQPKSYRKQEVWDQFKSYEPEVCLMAYVTLFVPEEVLNIPTHGTFQYHPSLLPRHRGPSSINWPLIWGETQTGLTIFWPDNGLDTGPILLQKEVAIKPDDTLGSIYFDSLFPMGVAAMMEALDLVKAGTAPKVPQEEAGATYEGWCKKENAQIDWSKPAQDVYNLIRGTNPQPGAWTTLNGEELQVFDCTLAEGITGAPGSVVAVGDAGITIAAGGGGGIVAQRVRSAGGGKVTGGEFALKAGLQAGATLGG